MDRQYIQMDKSRQECDWLCRIARFGRIFRDKDPYICSSDKFYREHIPN